MKKRICLFAGFDKNSKIQEYVLNYIRALAEVSDVYYMADCQMPEEELKKLSPMVKKAWAVRHEKYDFGSWQEMIKLIGWAELEKYEELILVNDSCYAPLFSLKDIFAVQEKQNFDFWGMTQNIEFNYHLQSYFLVLNNKIIKNAAFRDFFSKIKKEENLIDVVKNYEIKLTPILTEQGFSCGAYVQKDFKQNITIYPRLLIAEYKCPCLKIKCFTKPKEHLMEHFRDWKKFIKKYSGYDTTLIEQHLQSLGCDVSKNMNCGTKHIVFRKALRILSYILQFKVTKNNKLLVKVFKIPVFSKKLKK